MNKNKIKQFALWARTELIGQVSQRAYQYGITADGYGEADAVTISERALNQEEQKQRRELVAQIRQKGYQQVMEEVAYTWFNRFIALRFMEVNNYLPTHIRVFSDSNDQFKPEILNDVLHLELPQLDHTKVAQYLEANRTDDLYRYLLLLQCNNLNEALPVMFEPMGSYTEMLLPNNILKSGSILDRLVNDIPTEDWLDQVQIIGWLYQYYNSELKDETFTLLKKNIKVTKERIPAATQLFTPDWIVRYMVENSLGRLWLEGHPNETLKNSWQYYLEEAEQTAEVQAHLKEIRQTYSDIKPQKIKIIDPCMGSGHILVYAFDLLMQIYEVSGISQRDAVHSILENNLYGLDIDDRAAQLAYFAVMMKARQYDRRIFSRQIQPHLYSIKESNRLDENAIKDFAYNDLQLQSDLETLITELYNAKEYGSIVPVSSVDFAVLYQRVEELRYDDNLFLREIALKEILPLIQIAETMAQHYDVVVTNPPYMCASNMNEKLATFVKKHYPDSKSDLFAVFIERCKQMTADNGYQAMITQHSWMFLSSFEKLRTKMQAVDIVNMVHLGARAFEEIGGEVVQSTSFILRQSHLTDYKGIYCRLIEPTSQQGKEDMFLARENRYVATQDNFSKIPGSPIAYWASEKFIEAFSKFEPMQNIAQPVEGLKTGDNNKFLRFWFEVERAKEHLFSCDKDDLMWRKIAKGGAFRRWYGNLEYVCKWGNNGNELRDFQGASLSNFDLYFTPALTWTYITSGIFSMRACYNDTLYNNKGPACYVKEYDRLYLLSLMNTKVVQYYLDLLAPTIDCKPSNIANVPIVYINSTQISTIGEINFNISKQDWDSFETSWDFKKNPLI